MTSQFESRLFFSLPPLWKLPKIISDCKEMFSILLPVIGSGSDQRLPFDVTVGASHEGP